jgi:hypothetical protein
LEEVQAVTNAMTLDKANEYFRTVQIHLGEEVRAIDADDRDGLAVAEHEDGSVSFHTEDRLLTFILYPEADLVARRVRHGQQRQTSCTEMARFLEVGTILEVSRPVTETLVLNI